MIHLYHNNHLIHECAKPGRKGERAAAEFSTMVEAILLASSHDRVHTFKVDGEFTVLITTYYYDPHTSKWTESVTADYDKK